MNTLLCVIVVGFAQVSFYFNFVSFFCSETNLVNIWFQLCLSAPTNASDFLKLGEISEKVKAIPGANSQWIDEFNNITHIVNRDDSFYVQIEKIVCTQIDSRNICDINHIQRKNENFCRHVSIVRHLAPILQKSIKLFSKR